jgi:hypothetical protein
MNVYEVIQYVMPFITILLVLQLKTRKNMACPYYLLSFSLLLYPRVLETDLALEIPGLSEGAHGLGIVSSSNPLPTLDMP